MPVSVEIGLARPMRPLVRYSAAADGPDGRICAVSATEVAIAVSASLNIPNVHVAFPLRNDHWRRSRQWASHRCEMLLCEIC